MAKKCGQLKIGAGRAVIDIPASFFPYENYAGVYDELHARAILLDNGVIRIAFVVVELTSLGDDYTEEMRKKISDVSGVSFENIFLSASHTFVAPHLKTGKWKGPSESPEKDAAFVEFVSSAILSSVRKAMESMQSGRMGFGAGSSNVNVNRDMLTSKGWWKGTNFEAASDKTVAVIKFETLDGKLLAFFINYAIQSCIMLESVPLDGKVLVSSDLAGATARYVEKQYGDEVVALWNVGAAGDQDPLFVANRHVVDMNGDYSRIDIHEMGYVLIELLGERLGYEAVRVGNGIGKCKADIAMETIHKTVICNGQEIFRNIHEMKPSREYEYKPAKPLELPVDIIIVDNVAVIGVRPELVCKTALEIKEASPYKNTVIMTMVNGGAKYLPDAESYDRITYAAMNSMGARGSAELLRDEIISLLDGSVFA